MEAQAGGIAVHYAQHGTGHALPHEQPDVLRALVQAWSARPST